MLTVVGFRRWFGCDGTSRRDFLRAGALVWTGWMFPDPLRARAARRASPASTLYLKSDPTTP